MHRRNENVKHWLLLGTERQKLGKILDDSLAIATDAAFDFSKSKSICLLGNLFSIFIPPREPLCLLVNEISHV